MYNPYKDFSSYAGFDQKLVIAGHLKNQWVNHPGNPSFQYIGTHMPIFTLKAGVGLDLENIAEGNFNYKKARLSFNKVINISQVLVSVGARFSFNQISVDGASILTPEGDYQDGNINHNDQKLNNQLEKGIGLGYEISSFMRWHNYQLGLSLTETPAHELNLETFSYKYKETINIYFSGFFPIADNIQFQPSMSIRSDFITLQTDLSGIINLNGNIFGGLLLRGYNSKSLDAIGLIFGHKINRRYSVYYNYDLPISALRRTNEGSHELLIKMNLETIFGKPNTPKVIYNPRFLK